MSALVYSDEKLRAVRVSFPFVRHRHLASCVEGNPAVKLILKLLAFFPPVSFPGSGFISGLYHKSFHDAVEDVLFVILARAELHERATGERTFLGKQFDVDFPVRGVEDDFAGSWRFQRVHFGHEYYCSGILSLSLSRFFLVF